MFFSQFSYHVITKFNVLILNRLLSCYNRHIWLCSFSLLWPAQKYFVVVCTHVRVTFEVCPVRSQKVCKRSRRIVIAVMNSSKNLFEPRAPIRRTGVLDCTPHSQFTGTYDSDIYVVAVC